MSVAMEMLLESCEMPKRALEQKAVSCAIENLWAAHLPDGPGRATVMPFQQFHEAVESLLQESLAPGEVQLLIEAITGTKLATSVTKFEMLRAFSSLQSKGSLPLLLGSADRADTRALTPVSSKEILVVRSKEVLEEAGRFISELVHGPAADPDAAQGVFRRRGVLSQTVD